MKIVISSNTSWSIYNFRLNLIRALREEGFEVIIVAPYDKYTDALKKKFEYHDIFMNNKGTNPIEDFQTFFQYYKLYKKIKPSLALHYTIKPNIYGTLANSLLGIKTINNISGLGTLFIKQGFSTTIAKFLYKISLSRSSKVFFQNKDDYHLFINEKLVHIDKCGVLPGSGVDVKKFYPIQVTKKDNYFKFLLIARMLWDKGVGEYVEAAKIIKNKYKNVQFLLLGPIGVNNLTAIPKKQIEKWEEEQIINYLGETQHVKEQIAQVDCVVLPSYREGTSRTLLEAASMAKPIVTTNVPGCKEVVDDGVNGFLCRLKDSKDLSEKMEKILNLSEKERVKMGKRSREKIIKEFDEKIVIDKYIQTIKSLLKNQ